LPLGGRLRKKKKEAREKKSGAILLPPFLDVSEKRWLVLKKKMLGGTSLDKKKRGRAVQPFDFQCWSPSGRHVEAHRDNQGDIT